jgi:hypothetical protein
MERHEDDISDGVPLYIEPEDGRPVLTYPELTRFMETEDDWVADTDVDHVVDVALTA